MRTIAATAASVALASAVLAAPGGGDRPRRTTTFTETFSRATNEGQWTWNGGQQTFPAKGGNKGPYLLTRFDDTFAPQAATAFGVASEFTGDYRGAHVVGVGGDFITTRVDFSAAERPLSLLLTSDPGTPDDPLDDCTVYLLGSSFAPEPGQGWLSYAFDVPSDSATLPAGWGVLEGCPEATPDAAWNRTIQDVDELKFFYGDPTFFFIFQNFTVGIDNPSITRAIP